MEPVKIRVPLPHGPYAAESPWAEEVDAGAGLYRIDNILAFADGVSLGDVVRCERARDRALVAVEVIERSEHVTVSVQARPEPLSADAADPNAFAARLYGALVERIRVAEVALDVSGGVGTLQLLGDADAVNHGLDLAIEVSTEAGYGGEVADEGQRLGCFAWWTVSSPQYPTPMALEGADALLAEEPLAPVELDWLPAADPIAGAWPRELVDELRDRARFDDRLAACLEAGQYLPPLLIVVRDRIRGRFSNAQVGGTPFAVFPPSFEEQLWRDTMDADGRVRYCPDDAANEAFRAELVTLGVDPDADPRASYR